MSARHKLAAATDDRYARIVFGDRDAAAETCGDASAGNTTAPEAVGGPSPRCGAESREGRPGPLRGGTLRSRYPATSSANALRARCDGRAVRLVHAPSSLPASALRAPAGSVPIIVLLGTIQRR